MSGSSQQVPVRKWGIQDWYNSCCNSCAAHTDGCRGILQPKLEVDSSLIQDSSLVEELSSRKRTHSLPTVTVTFLLSKGFLPSILSSSWRACEAEVESWSAQMGIADR